MPTAVAVTTGRREIERRVLEIVTGLVAELGTLPARGRAAPGDLLDRDLGIGSLERVELALRLEQAFALRLGDAVMAEAERCGDLVDAVGAAVPPAVEPVEAPVVVTPAAGALPSAARTLAEALAWHAQASPERVHVVLRREDGGEEPITYGALWTRAAGVAGGLRALGVGAGDRVALMLRTEPAFFEAFFGALLAGAVPVPIYPPFRPGRIEEYARRQVGILRNAEARLLVAFGEAATVGYLLRRRVPTLRAVVTPQELAAAGGRAVAPG
ncbi:MAG TPA: AMP-binding protein, partial [Methylomirabilota bacterium]|nr:AMP-binding protein [Methylomirabilota bacterium]